MPTPMPSPTGSNKAKLFLSDSFYTPVAAYDSKRGLDAKRVQRAAKFLQTKLGADAMAEFKKVLGEDTDPMDVLIEVAGLLSDPSSENISKAQTLLSGIMGEKP